jgi:peptidyl-prolyl cis-trans isomerase A (cyclophilin A)
MLIRIERVTLVYHQPMPILAIVLAAMLAPQQPAPTPQAAATAEVSGKVVDRQGGFIPGVEVTLEAPPAAPTKLASRGTDGTFRFAAVAPGTYTMKFALAGFATYSRPRLVLAAGQHLDLTVAMEVDPVLVRNNVDYVPPKPEPEPLFDLAQGEIAVGVKTSVGTFYFAVDTKRAPITAANFLKYVDAKLYDDGRFHRATRQDNYTPSLPNRPMMNIIQGGINPARRAEGFPPIPLERTSVTGINHVTGVVSMARGNAADTATSDFFVLLDDQPSLDFGGLRFDDGQGGAAYGHVLSGLDVVRKIQQQPVDGQNLAAPVLIWRVWRLGSQK